MKAIAPLLMLAIASAASADPFDARVQKAKRIEASAEGQAFQKRLWGAIGNHVGLVMQKCFPSGVKADTDSFTLVATLMPTGAVAKVEVRPKTAMAQCFSKGFVEAPFPKPSAGLDPEGIPLVIEMKIKP